MRMNRYVVLASLLLLLAFGAGCMKNNAVKLTYALGPVQTSCLGDVIVFKFDDKRASTRLGKDSNGAAIDSLSDASDWVGWALFEELKAAGCSPKYRTSTVSPGETPLITGEVLEIALNQTGAATYKAKVALRVILEKPGTQPYAEKFTGEVEDVVLPGYGSESDLLAEALRSVLAEVVASFAKRI